MKVGKEICQKLFKGHSCAYAVHKDSNIRHIHIIFNSVSYATGKRYHCSKADLSNEKLIINKVLESNDFDIVKIASDRTFKIAPYDLNLGMEALEFTDEELAEDVDFRLENLNPDYDFNVKADDIDIESTINNINFESEDFIMKDDFKRVG